MTPLRAPDGRIFAVAQGPVVTGGFVAGRGGNSQALNHPTVGRVPGGALVEQSPPSLAPDAKTVRLQLKRADFTAAARIAGSINRAFGPETAQAGNSGLVAVRVPDSYAGRGVEFISQIENLGVDFERPSKIVVNERSGTIVMGKEIRISPVSILHGALTVEIQTAFAVSQPAPLGQGQTVVTPETRVKAVEEKSKRIALDAGATVEDLARGLLATGATARDVIAILQNLRAAGAIEAEVEVI